MLKLNDFTTEELEILKPKLNLSPLQEKIYEYRAKNIMIQQMSDLEKVSVSTINREIKKIRKKIARVI